MPLVKTFEEACAHRGLDPEKVLPDVTMFPERDQKALIAVAKLMILNPVLNDDKLPNWQNRDEYKWEPWFDMEKDENNPTGFRFDVSVYDNSYSYVGSRLGYRTREISDHAGKVFEDLYRDMMVISQP